MDYGSQIFCRRRKFKSFQNRSKKCKLIDVVGNPKPTWLPLLSAILDALEYPEKYISAGTYSKGDGGTTFLPSLDRLLLRLRAM